MTWQTLTKLAHDNFYRWLFFVRIPSLVSKGFSFFTRRLKKKNYRQNQSEPSIRLDTAIKNLQITNITNYYNCRDCHHDSALPTSSLEHGEGFVENRARLKETSANDKTKANRRRARTAQGPRKK